MEVKSPTQGLPRGPRQRRLDGLDPRGLMMRTLGPGNLMGQRAVDDGQEEPRRDVRRTGKCQLLLEEGSSLPTQEDLFPPPEEGASTRTLGPATPQEAV